jgi:serine/threonine-protein kinase
MAIGTGTTLINYEILSVLGKGGMGEVWRARDTKLGREVAIKTLPQGFSSDTERLSRFEREARVLAALNHPNIAAIYGLEESQGIRFLVMELVEGETLAELLKRGPLSVEEALKLGVQIATAIEAAHEKGVVHRDLKPMNIKITPEGKVKVLDFGLAKAFQAEEQDLSNSPTISMAATARGMILGTAAYMSPEQARGFVVDSRTDVWAFGCVLYEMLSGRLAFQGETVSDILASVLARDPDLASIHGRVNPKVEEILQRCLEKDPKRRWQAIGDVRMEIERVLASGELNAPRAQKAQSNWRMTGLLVAAAIVVAAVATWLLKPMPKDPRPITRFDFELPEDHVLRNTGRAVVAVSPDGRRFVYNTTRGLFIRSMDTLASRLVPGTEEALVNPFFSPDGEWVAYQATTTNELKKISITGGAPVSLTRTSALLFGASWGDDGNILFGQTEGIMQVSQNGGEPKVVIKTKPGEAAFGPSLLPDGKTILYCLTRSNGIGRWDQGDIVAQRIDSSDSKVLLRGGCDAQYVSTGHLVYAVGNVLFAVPFDARALEVKGGPVPLITGTARATGPAISTGTANYGISKAGALVYLNAVATQPSTQGVLAIVNRDGAIRRLDVPPADYRHPRISPDGQNVTVESVAENGQSIVWIYNLSGKTAIRRLTQDGNNTRPIWTSNSKKIVYGSDREKPQGIFWQPADGSGVPERLTSAEDGFVHYPESWSPKEDVLSFAVARIPLGGSSWGVWTLNLNGDRKPTVFYDVPTSNEFGSVFSPDGKWIAYASNNTGTNESNQFGIYVQPYPPKPGVKYEISRNGGAWPVWSPLAGELFYRLNVGEGNARIKAVNVTMSPPGFTSDRDLPIRGFIQVTNYRDYDVMPNGKDFLMVYSAGTQTQSAAPPRPRINIVLNWAEELKNRVSVH